MIKLDITSKDFLDEIASYVRGESSEEIVEYFESEDNVNLVIEGLIVLKGNVESQLAGYKSRSAKRRFELMLEDDDFDFVWSGYLAENADWRAKAIKFINSIECYIKHTKQILASYQAENDDAMDEDIIDALIAGAIDKINAQVITDHNLTRTNRAQ